jgi:hypothetical protein
MPSAIDAHDFSAMVEGRSALLRPMLQDAAAFSPQAISAAQNLSQTGAVNHSATANPGSVFFLLNSDQSIKPKND